MADAINELRALRDYANSMAKEMGGNVVYTPGLEAMAGHITARIAELEAAQASTFCRAPHPTKDRRCQLPAGHDGDHQQAGATDGVRWAQAAEPTDAEVEAWHKQCEALAGEGKLSLDVMGALFTANDLLRRGRGDQRLRGAASEVIAACREAIAEQVLSHPDLAHRYDVWDRRVAVAVSAMRAALGGAS